jgi:ABC-2 type transport system permease protein
MHNTLTIAGREFRSYFNSPVAYIVLGLAMAFLGFFFWPDFFARRTTSVHYMFDVLGWIMVAAAPAMAMGLMAEEKRTGTIELLMTMPVKDSDVVLGKYLGVLGLYGVLLLLTLPYPISVATLGDLDWGPVVSGYVGVFLHGSAMLAIGLMASSWTRNQLVAFMVGLILCCLFTIFMQGLMSAIPAAADVLEYLSLTFHFRSMARGVIDSRDVIYFLTVAAFALAIAFRSLESRRWS